MTDIERTLAFYRDVLGLRIVDRTENEARLGANDDPRVLGGPGQLTRNPNPETNPEPLRAV